MNISGSDVRQTKARALAMFNAGHLCEARALYEELCHAYEGDAEAWYFLGIIHMRLEAFEDAARCLGHSIELQPDIFEAHNNLGVAYIHLKDPQKAAACFLRAQEIRPASMEAQMNLGKALQEGGDPDAALRCYRSVLKANPSSAPVHDALGTVLRQLGRTEEGVTHYQHALQLDPDFVNACLNLANALGELGRLSEAEALYRNCLVLDPGFVEAYLNLANLTLTRGSYRETEQLLYKALELKPDFPEVYNSLGILYQQQTLLDKAVNHYRKALELSPDFAAAHNNLLGALNYTAACSVEEIYRAHVAYGERHADSYLAAVPGHDNSRDAGRRLRVGYVSADFRTHSVAYYFEPIVAGHDRSRVEVYCYASVRRPDETTQRLEGLSDHWRDISRMSDAAVAEQVRADRIDVLVDLGGHMEGHRLKVFARKPAPVQVTYLGYPNTTGMQAIDYRLTDRWADPEGESERWYTEALVRLESGFLCYRAPAESPEAGPLPARVHGVVTFGCFNNSLKVTPEVVALWGGILREVPGSRLLLKSRQLADAGVQARFRALFAAAGIDAERLELLGYVPGKGAHLALYDRVDIGLDPFPYHGTTTTCEALWMGVPVVTLAGDRHASRVGVSLLHQVGLEDWIAHSEEEYRSLAVRRARDMQALEALRGGLRARMQASSLMDEPGFMRQLESAYRTLWQQWCDQG